MSEVVFRVRRTTIVWRVVIVLAGSAALAALVWWWETSPRLSGLPRVVLWALLGCYFGVVAYSTAGPVRLLFSRHGLTMNEDGLTDWTAGLGFVPWYNIAGFRSKRVMGLSSLEVHLVDHSEFLRGLGPLRRVLWRHAKERHGLSPEIVTGYLEGGDTVEEALETARGRA